MQACLSAVGAHHVDYKGFGFPIAWIPKSNVLKLERGKGWRRIVGIRVHTAVG